MATQSSRLSSIAQADSPSLPNAEQRAAQAEHRVEQLEHRIEELENTTHPGASSPRQPTAPAAEAVENEPLAHLREEPMMDHLLNALSSGQDIGHYGRLVFAMVAHHFLDENTTIQWLTKDPDFSVGQAELLLRQVESRDYNPPRRDRILEWQSQQEFPIIPSPEDPDCGNVYRNLKFPQSVYEHIQGYQEEKHQAQDHPEAQETTAL